MRRLDWCDSLVAVLFLLCVLAGPAFSQTDEASLTADRTTEGEALLYWGVSRWQPEQVGFALQRREVLADGTFGRWNKVGPEAIAPDFSVKSLTDLDLDRVLEARPGLTEDRLDTEKVIAVLKDSPDELKKVVFISANDWQWAVAFGFGYVDSSADLGTAYEYALMPVLLRDGRRLAGQILAQQRLAAGFPELECPPLQSLTAVRTKQPGVVRVSWSVAKKYLPMDTGNPATSVAGFAIYGGSPDEALTAVVRQIWVQEGMEDEGGESLTFTHGDTTAGVKARKYAIAPINKLDRIGKKSKRVLARALGSELSAPSNLTATLVDGAVRLKWEHENPADSPFAGFRVLRANAVRELPVAVDSELLPIGRRFFLDESSRDAAGKDVTYSLVAVSGDQRADAICGPLVVHVPSPAPLAPKSFTAAVAVRENQYYLDIELVETPSQAVVGYEVRERDEAAGQWIECGRFVCENGHASMPFTPGHCGMTSFKCRAVTQDNVMGDYSDVLTIAVPEPNGPSSVAEFIVQTTRDRLEFRWKALYKETLKGFRIMMDGDILADETELNALIREWTHSDIPREPHKYEIVAVNVAGQTSNPKAATELGENFR